MITEDLLFGIEIKSDSDTYARLKKQVKNYDLYYDRNIIVAGSSHGAHVSEHVPKYWGIITVELDASGNPDFDVLREPQDNPKEKAALLNKAITKERQISNERVTLLSRELKAMKQNAAQSKNDAATNEAIAQKEAEIWRAKEQAETRSLRMVRQVATANKQMNAAASGGGGIGRTKEDAEAQAKERLRIERFQKKRQRLK